MIERLELWRKTDPFAEWSFIATRGASNGELSGPSVNNSATIYFWPQQDKANKEGKIPSEDWLTDAVGSLNGVSHKSLIVRLPKEVENWIEDWNDWCKKGASAGDLTSRETAKGAKPNYVLTAKSVMHFSESPIDESQNLLGNRYLERTQGGVIIGPSGHGKSSLTIQKAILFSCGRVAFGIKPAEALRVLIVQAEDDDNDLIEMSQMVKRLELTQKERELVMTNTHCEWLNDKVGLSFIQTLREILKQYRADLIFINPLTAYTGCDIGDDRGMTQFLREWLTPLLKAFRYGLEAIHHTAKTQFQNTHKFSWFDWMYSGAGRAIITNWARTVLVIAPSDMPGSYRFIAAKRFDKIGWQEREYWYSHSIEDGKILWVPSDQDQIASGRKGKNTGPEDLLALIPKINPIPLEKLLVEAKQMQT